MEQVTVRVPATTANLAAGFDTLGCALTLYNTVSFRLQPALSFSGCDSAYQSADNLAAQGFACVYRHLGQPVPGAHIAIQADIPVCSGLGSSAAMLAAGAVAANALSGAAMKPEALLALITPLEGHPDNLAPALLGGMTASMITEEGRIYTVRYQPHSGLRFVALTPGFSLSTQKARSVLPPTVSFADAVYNGSHLAVLLRALETGDEEIIAAALRDKLHQPYRLSLIDEYKQVRSIARECGCNALCISGAGPTLLCITRDEGLAERLSAALTGLRNRWQVRSLQADAQGAQLLASV